MLIVFSLRLQVLSSSRYFLGCLTLFDVLRHNIAVKQFARELDKTKITVI